MPISASQSWAGSGSRQRSGGLGLLRGGGRLPRLDDDSHPASGRLFSRHTAACYDTVDVTIVTTAALRPRFSSSLIFTHIYAPIHSHGHISRLLRAEHSFRQSFPRAPAVECHGLHSRKPPFYLHVFSRHGSTPRGVFLGVPRPQHPPLSHRLPAYTSVSCRYTT